MGEWRPRVGRPLLGAPDGPRGREGRDGPAGPRGPAARTAACWLVAGCAVLVTALGVLFAHQSTADGFDRAVDRPVIGWLSGHGHLQLWLASPGTAKPAVVLVAAAAVACLLAGRLGGALLAALTVPVAVLLDEALLKPLVDRRYGGSLAYPSGHVTTVSALAATATVLLLIPPQEARTRLPRIALTALAWAVTVVVAVAVTSLRWHYFTDTLAGTAVSVGTAAGLALLIDLPVTRRALGRLCRAWPGQAATPADPSGLKPAGQPPRARKP